MTKPVPFFDNDRLKNMEQETFDKIRKALVLSEGGVSEGKMMSSPAIQYEGHVFAFFFRTKKMVFKMGKEFVPNIDEMTPFNPFKNKSPLTGWFEIPFEHKDLWFAYTKNALKMIKNAG